MTYTQQLEYLDFPSLWYGRLRGDMAQIYRITNGIDDMNCEKYFESSDHDGTRISNNKLYIPDFTFCETKVMINLFQSIFNMLEHKIKMYF